MANFFDPTEVTHSQEVGHRIAQARRELAVRLKRDVLRGEVAEAVGVDPSTITAWESGRKSPRDAALTKLAAYLGVTPAWLRYGIREASADVVIVGGLPMEQVERISEEEQRARQAGNGPRRRR